MYPPYVTCPACLDVYLGTFHSSCPKCAKTAAATHGTQNPYFVASDAIAPRAGNPARDEALKLAAIGMLNKGDLLDLAAEHGIVCSRRDPVDSVRRAILRAPRPTAAELIEVLFVPELRAVCDALGVSDSGRKAQLVARLLGLTAQGGRTAIEDDGVEWAEEDGESEDEEALDAYGLEEALGYDGPIALRNYQREAVDRVLRGLQTAHPDRHPLLHIATGGGKTLVANHVLARLLGPGDIAIWITKDWRLLRQAAGDLVGHQQGFPASRLARLGGDGTCLQDLQPFTRPARGVGVVYTTLHTFARRARFIGSLRPRVVVWDECHWAVEASLGRHLLQWCRARGVPMLGLTATPRGAATQHFVTTYRKTFPELVRDGFLAEPRVQAPVQTGVAWEPTRRRDGFDFDAPSLDELGRSRSRNHVIVQTYGEGASRYGKTLVFACNIDHANRLCRMFTGAGVAAAVLHSDVPQGDQHEIVERFRGGEIRVLVNVAMLTHGIDIPDVRTVFLARPTLSDILFPQMVGRGCRLSDGKTFFHVVEFTDNLTRFGDQLQRAKDFYSGAGGGQVGASALRAPDRTAAPPKHLYDPKGDPRWIPADASPSAIAGLWYREGQSFGVELELTSHHYHDGMPDEDWRQRAEVLRRGLAGALGSERVSSRVHRGHGEAEDYGRWQVEHDGTCGWEVKSPILVGRAGFEEVARACAALTEAACEAGLRVNHRTGVHVHLGWWSDDLEELRRALYLAGTFEPALGTLVAPSRIARFDGLTYDPGSPNDYCRPVSTVLPLATVRAASSWKDLAALDERRRYVSFNLAPLARIGTVEVRLHNGSTDADKILLWLSLWMQILWAASRRESVEPPPDRRVITPDGDILELLERYLPATELQQRAFLERLHERRLEVLDSWKKIPALAAWTRFADRWSAPRPAAEGAETDAASPTVWYFAYGANMDPDVMRSRCPSAVPGDIAWAPDVGLAFAGHSSRWGGPTATLVSRQGAQVPGRLWRISERDLRRLDAHEGAPATYQRRLVTVQAAGVLLQAHAYVHQAAPGGQPTGAYLATLQRGYRTAGLSDDHLRGVL